ncbi:hypothetical protein DPMN_000325 [Dreissena polymorpha]|uniref:Uncharacterized protein n=1 Tax=Dreissena polymorpha TaxID=45954 RepID=A0A9D4RPE4_DREPO|nr:hypothetical protein DPMN_000325 [Dreissena polymorpha]
MHTSCHHSYDSIACVLKEATSDDDYNRLNEITETEYVNKIDNVHSHVQGSDNDIYDHTADAPEMHDRRSSYSHVKWPFPPSGHLHGTEHDISNMYDHTTDDYGDS